MRGTGMVGTRSGTKIFFVGTVVVLEVETKDLVGGLVMVGAEREEVFLETEGVSEVRRFVELRFVVVVAPLLTMDDAGGLAFVTVFAGAPATARPAFLTLLTSPSATLFFPVIAGAFVGALSDAALFPGADETEIDDLLFELDISHKL
jgi:hypothetical protein